MDDAAQARQALLMHRNRRRLRTPAINAAWRAVGISTSAMSNEHTERLIAWLRANWRQPLQPETQLQQRIDAFRQRDDMAVVLNFWEWDEAVALVVSSVALSRIAERIGEVYPDGFLITDRQVTRGLLVDFDDQDGTQIAELGVC